MSIVGEKLTDLFLGQSCVVEWLCAVSCAIPPSPSPSPYLTDPATGSHFLGPQKCTCAGTKYGRELEYLSSTYSGEVREADKRWVDTHVRVINDFALLIRQKRWIPAVRNVCELRRIVAVLLLSSFWGSISCVMVMVLEKRDCPPHPHALALHPQDVEGPVFFLCCTRSTVSTNGGLRGFVQGGVGTGTCGERHELGGGVCCSPDTPTHQCGGCCILA